MRLLLILALLAYNSTAKAQSRSELAYPFEQVWTAAVRMVRVDLGCAIVEKDRDEGYFIFDYQYADRSYKGSIELVPTRVNGINGVLLVVQVQGMPKYVESMISTRLGRKLNEEFGEPLSRPSDAKESSKPPPPANKEPAKEPPKSSKP